MDKESLLRWKAGYDAAQSLERRERRAHPPNLAESLAHGVSLLDFAIELHGWPLPADPVSERELVEARATWAKLRRRLGKT